MLNWKAVGGFRLHLHIFKILAFILKYFVPGEIQNCYIVKKETITET